MAITTTNTTPVSHVHSPPRPSTSPYGKQCLQPPANLCLFYEAQILDIVMLLTGLSGFVQALSVAIIAHRA